MAFSFSLTPAFPIWKNVPQNTSYFQKEKPMLTLGRKQGARIIVVGLVVVLMLPGIAQALTGQQKALVGLKGVQVVVKQMQPGAELLGLSREQLKTDVEMRLWKAGVRVLTSKEAHETPGRPCLYVNVNTQVRRNLPLCTYLVSVTLNEIVKLASGFQTAAGIWNTETIGSVGAQRMGQIQNVVSEAVDRFIKDYLAANPKH
jgi:hypothetical protein